MLLQPYKSYLIIDMIKEVEAHEIINHWTFMKNCEVKNKHKNKNVKLKTILSIWSFKWNIFPDVILLRQISILCAHEVMQQWGVNYWETYGLALNWINVKSLLAISSIHEFPIISIVFVLSFTQIDLDMDFFVEVLLVMVVDGNRG